MIVVRPLVPVLLDSRGAKPCQAVVADGRLPGQELFHRQRVTITRFFQAQQATTYRGDNLGFPADHPAARIGRRKVRDRQRTAIGADDIFNSGPYHFGHWTLYTYSRPHNRDHILPHLKFA